MFPLGTSLTRLDNSRSGEGFTRNFGDLQQVVHEQQERLKAFNSQLENFNLIVGSLRREQREHADDVASQLRELSKQLTSVKVGYFISFAGLFSISIMIECRACLLRVSDMPILYSLPLRGLGRILIRVAH